MKNIVFLLSILLSLALFTPSVVRGADADNGSMLSILPAGGCAEGWVLEEKPVLYTVDTLFDHINGEAELYLPYGFDILATARYVKKETSGSPFIADVYRMGSLLDAFGIYSNYRKAEASACDVGADCFRSSSQLLFYQDRYFVRLQATDTPTPGQDVFLACGRAISAKLPPGKNQPAELEILKVTGVAPKTERYISQSVLGYPFFRRGLTADAIVGRERTQVFVVIEDSATAALKALDEYRADLNASGKIISSTDTDGRPAITASDPLYRGVYIEQSGRYLIGAIRLKDPSSAKPLVESLRARLGK